MALVLVAGAGEIGLGIAQIAACAGKEVLNCRDAAGVLWIGDRPLS